MLRAGLIGCWLAVSLSTFAQTPGKVDFTRDVEPLFQKRCYMCHGPQQQMSGLRFDQKESADRVIQPGKSASSRLIQMVSGTQKKVMPPIGPRLTAAEIGMLRSWIDEGAPWAAGGAQPAVHWSFRKIERPEPPAVGDRAWVRNPIDQFVLAKLDSEGIAPSPEAGELRSSGAPAWTSRDCSRPLKRSRRS